jgi:hypothetical protein
VNSWPPPDSNPNEYNLSHEQSLCVLTNHALGLKRAHIVPKEENDWFRRQEMFPHGGDIGIDNPKNIILLRADVHKLYDSRNFVVVPKKESLAPDNRNSPSSPEYVVHYIGRLTGEWKLYHNVPLQRLDGTHWKLYFARFSWSIIPLVRPFLLMGHARHIVRFNDADAGESIVEKLTGPVLRRLYGGEGSTGAEVLHPRKRGRADDEQVDEGEEAEMDASETEIEDYIY